MPRVHTFVVACGYVGSSGEQWESESFHSIMTFIDKRIEGTGNEYDLLYAYHLLVYKS